MNKVGKCKCGCGQTTNRWKQNRFSKGVKKGDYRDFVSGHYKKDPQYSTCHPDRRVKAKGLCGSCYNMSLLKNNPDAHERAKKRRRDSHKQDILTRDPEKYAAKQRERRYKHRYGITVSEYNSILSHQGNKCAICREVIHSEDNKLYVDHDHSTGNIRGLLCAGCNTAMGIVDKGKVFIAKCFEYKGINNG